eukprot:scaffold4243_cov112-Isochrysis_galbana.AAC.1
MRQRLKGNKRDHCTARQAKGTADNAAHHAHRNTLALALRAARSGERWAEDNRAADEAEAGKANRGTAHRKHLVGGEELGHRRDDVGRHHRDADGLDHRRARRDANGEGAGAREERSHHGEHHGCCEGAGRINEQSTQSWVVQNHTFCTTAS